MHASNKACLFSAAIAFTAVGLGGGFMLGSQFAAADESGKTMTVNACTPGRITSRTSRIYRFR